MHRRKIKTEMNAIWKKIYEQNYHKSLDHRSFYFKQVTPLGNCNPPLDHRSFYFKQVTVTLQDELFCTIY